MSLNFGQEICALTIDSEQMQVHFIGIGVCGQPVIQIQLIPDDDDSWRLFRVENDYAVPFGKNEIDWSKCFKLINISEWKGSKHG